VHFPAREDAEIIARRLLRTSLSDLAAKGAVPFGYFLMTAWPPDRGEPDRKAFRRGLAEDGGVFGVALLGGDTVSTAGPLVVSATVLGWVPRGQGVLRSGARAGDALVVCGNIGDGWLGLAAVQGRVADPDGVLAARYRLPTPLLAIGNALIEYARAAADVSDGLIADATHVAEASGLGFSLDLDIIPLSIETDAWRRVQGDSAAARLALATGGDDYAIVCAVDPAVEVSFIAAVEALDVPAARAGTFEAELGMRITVGGLAIDPGPTGWRHS
jgi:thiamine-monophosphate kinase